MDHQLLEYLFLAGLWTAYCAIHSLLISNPVRHRIRHWFPEGHRYHRLFFNLFSIVTFIPIATYSLTLKSSPVFQWDGSLRLLQALFVLTGIVLVVAGARSYDFKEFIGFSQISSPDTCQSISANCDLNTTGILGLLRHPWYTALILMLWTRDLDPAALIVNTVWTFYIIIGTFLEEQKLIGEYGQAYRDYQNKVSMFLPIKWLQAKLFQNQDIHPR